MYSIKILILTILHYIFWRICLTIDMFLYFESKTCECNANLDNNIMYINVSKWKNILSNCVACTLDHKYKMSNLTVLLEFLVSRLVSLISHVHT